MIDPELLARLNELSEKIDQTYRAAESARKYLFWTGAVTVAFVVLPIIGLLFAVPAFISTYTTTLGGLGM